MQLVLLGEYVHWAIRGNTWQERAGWSLVVLSQVYWDGARGRDWWWNRSAPPVDETQARRVFMRATLERRLRRAPSYRRWLTPLVTASCFAGWGMALRPTVVGVLGCGIVAVIGAGVIRIQLMDSPRRIEEQIARHEERVAQAQQ